MHYKVAIFDLELRKCTSRKCASRTRLVLQSCDFRAGALRKCTSCTRLVLQSCDFRAGDAEVYFAYQTCATKLRFSSWSCGSVLRVLDLYYKVANFELELRKCTLRTRLVLQSCDFRAGDAEVYFAYQTCATKLRFSSWRCGTVLRLLDLYYKLRVLDLYYKVSIFELEFRKCTSRTRLVRQSCDPLPKGPSIERQPVLPATHRLDSWHPWEVPRKLLHGFSRTRPPLLRLPLSVSYAEMYFSY